MFNVGIQVYSEDQPDGDVKVFGIAVHKTTPEKELRSCCTIGGDEIFHSVLSRDEIIKNAEEVMVVQITRTAFFESRNS